jgi:hypothetical protein
MGIAQSMKLWSSQVMAATVKMDDLSQNARDTWALQACKSRLLMPIRLES